MDLSGFDLCPSVCILDLLFFLFLKQNKQVKESREALPFDIEVSASL